MGVKPLSDAEILIGQFTGKDEDIRGNILDPKLGGKVFADNCPLWAYVLAETKPKRTTFRTSDGDKRIETRQLGPVGGRIVAETIVGLLAGDSSSFLSQHPLWRPERRLTRAGKFGLRELIAAALG
jgi:hypothetical protein